MKTLSSITFGLIGCLFLLPTIAQDESENTFWGMVDCGKEKQLWLYLEQYPKGDYVDEARKCLKSIIRGKDNEPDDSTEIKDLLAQCEVHMEANRLTTGEGGNAMACFNDILSRDPDNISAREGILRIEKIYEE
ncbi:MAG: hypothetical protein ACI8P9_004422 [Parasphingorhabdus sp.]|jgi:hypothetical protein